MEPHPSSPPSRLHATEQWFPTTVVFAAAGERLRALAVTSRVDAY